MKIQRIVFSIIVCLTLATMTNGCSLFKQEDPQIIVIPMHPTNPINITVDPSKPAPIIVTEDKVPVVIKKGDKFHFDGYAVSNITLVQMYDGDFTKDYIIVKYNDVAQNTCYLLSEKILTVDKSKGIQLKDTVKKK